jgi:hypothetical protein
MKYAACVLAVLFCFGLGVSAQQKKKPKKPSIQVSAGELIKEYDDNPVTADEKYAKKDIEITGKITEIGSIPNVTQGRYVFLASQEGMDHPPFKINCSIYNRDGLLAKCKKGDTVKLRGFCSGLYKDDKVYHSDVIRITACTSLTVITDEKPDGEKSSDTKR